MNALATSIVVGARATADSPVKLVFALLIAAGVLGLGLALVLMSGDNRGKIERRLGDVMQEPRTVPTDERGRGRSSRRATRRSPRPR